MTIQESKMYFIYSKIYNLTHNKNAFFRTSTQLIRGVVISKYAVNMIPQTVFILSPKKKSPPHTSPSSKRRLQQQTPKHLNKN